MGVHATSKAANWTTRPSISDTADTGALHPVPSTENFLADSYRCAKSRESRATRFGQRSRIRTSKLQMTSSHGRYSCQFGPDPRLTLLFVHSLKGAIRSEVWMTLPMTPRTLITCFNSGPINRSWIPYSYVFIQRIQ